ncbi:MAG: TnpV protein [Oscillospiraceae bacterium]
MAEITYSKVGDYNLPNLILPQEPEVHLGKYALLRKKYLERSRRVMFINLLTSCKLNEHLMDIEKQAYEMMENLTSQMKQSQGVTEQMKQADQMKWVQMMNNIRHSAEETVLSDLIYA